MAIRALQDKDLPHIERILRATGFFTHEEVRVALELVDIFLTQPDQRDYKLYCSVGSNDVPLGYVCFGPTPLTDGTYDLYWIAVDPRVQGRGIGRKLWTFVEDTLAQQNGRLLLIETSSQSRYEPTHHFYRRMDCREIARIPDFYSVGDDRVIYCKLLRLPGKPPRLRKGQEPSGRSGNLRRHLEK